MTGLQRYGIRSGCPACGPNYADHDLIPIPDGMPDEPGFVVLAADAEAAIDEARSQEAKVHAATERWSPLSYLQGQRDVFAYHPEWTVTDMCKPDCLPCQRLTELITEREKGYEEGQRDAIAAAVQRVEALIDPWPNTSPGLIRRGNVFAAIKGEP